MRAMLPPHARDQRDEVAEPRVPWRVALWGDVRGFAQVYVAGVFAMTAFLM